MLDSRTFVTAATSNQIRLVYEDAPRGRILDRNGQVLVDNRRTQAITVNRNELNKLENKDEVKARLAALLNLTREELDKRIADVRYSQYKPIPVAEGDAVPEELYIYVKEHQEDFPSVEATIVSERTYPNDPPSLGAHVLGYVGEINDRELADRKKDGYRLGDSLGKTGVELVYEDLLRGEPGVTKLQVNSAGEVVKGEPLAVVPPNARPRRRARRSTSTSSGWPRSRCGRGSRRRGRRSTATATASTSRRRPAASSSSTLETVRCWRWRRSPTTTRPSSSTGSRPTCTRC